MSTSTTDRPSFYITLGKERRAIALATGLSLGSQRIEHWIWFNRLLDQGKGIAAITSTDAFHDLGMSLNKWKAFSRWIRDEGWAQIEKAYGQGFIWSHGQQWHSTDWQTVNAQAEAEHLASREPLKRRATVKRAAIGRNGSSGVKSTNGETAPIAPKPGMESSSSGPKSTNGETGLVVRNQPMEHGSSGPKSTNAIGPKSTNGIPETDSSATVLSPLKPLSQTSLRAQTSFGSQTSGNSAEAEPQAEVEQQASASGSGPAEISEQPTATTDVVDSTSGTSTRGMTVREAGLYQHMLRKQNDQRQVSELTSSEPAQPDQPDLNSKNDCDCVDDQPKVKARLQPWTGLPIHALVDGDLLVDERGVHGLVELEVRNRDEVELWINGDDGFRTGPITNVDGLRGWSMAPATSTTATVSK